MTFFSPWQGTFWRELVTRDGAQKSHREVMLAKGFTLWPLTLQNVLTIQTVKDGSKFDQNILFYVVM